MLLLALLFLYIFFSCFFIGKLVAGNICKVQFANVFHYTGVGIISIIAVSRIWSMAFPISIWLPIFIFAASLVSFAINRRGLSLAFFRKNILILAPVFLMTVFFCSQQSISYDEALYHASYIKWMNDYGIVKGLGNIHGRLAFNSNWHLFASVFNFNDLFHQPLNQANGFFIIWLVCFFMKERELYATDRGVVSFAGASIIFLFFPVLFVYHVIDPSADYITIFWTLLLLYELYFFKEKKGSKDVLLLIVVSSVFLITVKISTLMLLCTCFLLIKNRVTISRGRIILLLVSVILVIVPWLASNYLLSGYLIYPSVNVEYLNPVWKIPSHAAHMDIAGIKNTPFARWSGQSIEAVAQLDAITKYGLLFQGLRGLDQILFISGFAALIFIVIYNVRQSKEDIYKRFVAVLALVSYVFIFLTAPDFRFLAGYIYFGYGAVIILLPRIRLSSLIVSAACILQFAVSVKLYARLKPKVVSPASNRTNGLTINPIKPERYPVCDYDTLIINNTPFHVYDETKQQFNWDNNIGIYTPVDTVHMLGRTVKDGFYK